MILYNRCVACHHPGDLDSAKTKALRGSAVTGKVPVDGRPRQRGEGNPGVTRLQKFLTVIAPSLVRFRGSLAERRSPRRFAGNPAKWLIHLRLDLSGVFTGVMLFHQARRTCG
jgi:hypothetical protein